ncbi:hypothetical protein L596_021711 [Steinernema carpocapsae]|uniref:Uncharacterized protein n=1 Tax=Steinernema carpocapsae TaxID=34508 RepID=A0A4U5MJN6_STECR|nr:hypothetical protein L596_021711 [Steinernema carpocapsae]
MDANLFFGSVGRTCIKKHISYLESPLDQYYKELGILNLNERLFERFLKAFSNIHLAAYTLKTEAFCLTASFCLTFKNPNGEEFFELYMNATHLRNFDCVDEALG